MGYILATRWRPDRNLIKMRRKKIMPHLNRIRTHDLPVTTFYVKWILGILEVENISLFAFLETECFIFSKSKSFKIAKIHQN